MNSPKRSQLTLRIPEDKDKRLTEEAKQLGISKNSLFMIIVDEFLKQVDQDKPA